MDTFMDKLSQRYSAGEMIKANSEADAAQMNDLQEQVEAYEAVLQEMRKLNYKNTELTEKMYSLVDESIEKVRTLQIEASENGANTELISREMSDAVTGALNEALNNMDSTVARTISESLASALAAPTEEIKQSTIATEGMKESVSKVNAQVESLNYKIDTVNGQFENVNTKIDTVNGQLEEIKSQNALVMSSFDELKNAAPAESASVNASLDPETLTYLKENLASVSNLVASLKSDDDEMKSMLVALRDNGVNVSAIEGVIRENDAKSQEAFDVVKNASESTKLAIEALEAKVAYGNEEIKNTLAAAGGNDEVKATIANGNDEVKAAVSELANSNDEVKNAVAGLTSRNAEMKATVDSLSAASEENKNFVSNIWNSVEATRATVASLAENSNNNQSSSNDDIRNAVLEILTGTEEIRTAVRNLKTANDDTKTTLKTAFDSAIYGLKQDNKEIVEFMQRMNTNILAKPVDPDAERKEEEARQKEEQRKQEIEDRIKQAEDFMHKESVKVYRNVQAVINEKTDRQTDGIDSKVKGNTAKIGQVKVIAIIAAALSGLSLAAQIVSMLGLI